MSLGTILLIILVIALLGGFSGLGGGPFYGTGYVGGGGLGASAMFLDAGYQVFEAGDADDALRIFESNAEVGLLFTDVSMPGSLNGSDLARQVAARWPGV